MEETMNRISYKLLLMILFTLITLLLTGCASTFSSSYSAGYGGKVRVTKMPNMGNGFLEYKSYSHLLKELREEADIKMWTSDMFEEKKKLLPAGGSIYFKYCRSSPKWSHTAVIKQNGKVIKRHLAQDVISHSVNSYLHCFNGSLLFYLDHQMKEPFEVFIIDEYDKERYEYTVFPEDS